MNNTIPIHKLAAQLGLTSRTLRHWEAEGLFCCMRDNDSGWRVYDEATVLGIRITALLRQLDIPVRDIKSVLDISTYDCLGDVVQKQIAILRIYSEENASTEKRLLRFLSALEKQNDREITAPHLLQLLSGIKSDSDHKNEQEESITMNTQNAVNALRFITLPPMRAVYNIAVGISPEDEASEPVFEWLESAKLTGTARMFGGNMPPMPSGASKPYGYGMCASIPENVEIPGHLKEMRLPGGVYAMLESTDDIPASWKRLMKLLSDDAKYTSDRSRLCFEEHIRKDDNGFMLILLEPIKKK